MTEKKEKETVVLGPGAKDEAMAKKEAKAMEKTADDTTFVTEETK